MTISVSYQSLIILNNPILCDNDHTNLKVDQRNQFIDKINKVVLQ